MGSAGHRGLPLRGKGHGAFTGLSGALWAAYHSLTLHCSLSAWHSPACSATTSMQGGGEKAAPWLPACAPSTPLVLPALLQETLGLQRLCLHHFNDTRGCAPACWGSHSPCRCWPHAALCPLPPPRAVAHGFCQGQGCAACRGSWSAVLGGGSGCCAQAGLQSSPGSGSHGECSSAPASTLRPWSA